MGENLLQASFLASLVHRVYNPLQKVFLCVFKQTLFFLSLSWYTVGTSLG